MNPHRVTHTRRRKPTASRLLVISLLAVCAAGGVSGGAQSTGQPAGNEKGEAFDRIPKHLPIKVKFKKADKVKDLSNDNWLADLEVEVQNTGTKPIYFLSIFLDFVDVKRDSGDRIGYEFQYGRTKLVEIDQLATPEDVPIAPGEAHVFKLHKDYVDGWNWYRTQVERKPQPKKVVFSFSTLSHGDGTGYVTNGGIFVSTRPRAKFSRGNESGGVEAVSASSGCRPARPPDPAFKLASYFLPAASSPVTFFRARAAGTTRPQRAVPASPRVRRWRC